MIFLTFTNGYSGVYESQVLDVCRFLRGSFGIRARVIALVSARSYFRERRLMREADSEVTVVPMVPGVRNWRWNALLLYPMIRAMGERGLVGRSEFAANIGFMLRRWGAIDTVVFDGRSARAAEAREYDLGGKRVFSPEVIEELEARGVSDADFRMSISTRLVDYWKDQYDYASDRHVVIPCTLSQAAESRPDRSPVTRADLGIPDGAKVLVYAGSAAEWQSFAHIDSLAGQALRGDENAFLLLLSDVDSQRLRVCRDFPGRVCQRWVEPSAVPSYLELADYGLLLREPTVTNAVSCPTKFAEYLAAGLDILITPDVGDLTAFVEEHSCGWVVREQEGLRPLLKRDGEARVRNMTLARDWFTKGAHQDAYAKLVEWLEGRVGRGSSADHLHSGGRA